jgi:hypothetical protein
MKRRGTTTATYPKGLVHYAQGGNIREAFALLDEEGIRRSRLYIAETTGELDDIREHLGLPRRRDPAGTA